MLCIFVGLQDSEKAIQWAIDELYQQGKELGGLGLGKGVCETVTHLL